MTSDLCRLVLQWGEVEEPVILLMQQFYLLHELFPVSETVHAHLEEVLC